MVCTIKNGDGLWISEPLPGIYDLTPFEQHRKVFIDETECDKAIMALTAQSSEVFMKYYDNGSKSLCSR